MPDAPPEPAVDLAEQYASQVAADLERVGAEIATLEERLARLRRQHTLLADLQNTLHGRNAARAAPRTPPTPGPPAPQGDGTAAGPGGARQRHEVTLVDLVRDHLAAQGEPCSAGEIMNALADRHPYRAFKITVVRSTAEALVARGEAERFKKGTFVFYRSPTARDDADT